MHLDDLDLDALLDGALTNEERRAVERHLASCSACASRLADRQRLFALIESATEAAPERPLRDGVVAALRPQPAALPRWAWLVSAVQAVAAVALVVGGLLWIGPEVVNRQLGTLTVFGLQTAWAGLQTILDVFLVTGAGLTRWLAAVPNVSQSGWVLAWAAAAAALGLFGNGIWFALNWGKVRKP